MVSGVGLEKTAIFTRLQKVSVGPFAHPITLLHGGCIDRASQMLLRTKFTFTEILLWDCPETVSTSSLEELCVMQNLRRHFRPAVSESAQQQGPQAFLKHPELAL